MDDFLADPKHMQRKSRAKRAEARVFLALEHKTIFHMVES